MMWSFITTQGNNISKFYISFVQILTAALTCSLIKCEFSNRDVTHWGSYVSYG